MAAQMNGKIGVKNLEIYIKKGLYASENNIENHFRITAEVGYRPENLKENEYLNYERLVEIIQTAMQSDVKLLESIAKSILQSILDEWSIADSASVIIEKCNPAFSNSIMDAVVVSLEAFRD